MSKLIFKGDIKYLTGDILKVNGTNILVSWVNDDNSIYYMDVNLKYIECPKFVNNIKLKINKLREKYNFYYEDNVKPLKITNADIDTNANLDIKLESLNEKEILSNLEIKELKLNSIIKENNGFSVKLSNELIVLYKQVSLY